MSAPLLIKKRCRLVGAMRNSIVEFAGSPLIVRDWAVPEIKLPEPLAVPGDISCHV
jgi:hypothetical protein